MSRPQALSRGKRLLKDMLPRARAAARKQTADHASFLPHTLLGQSVLEAIDENNLLAVMIYQDPPGSWYGDVVLRDMPIGSPDSLGTPSSMPRRSRTEAEEDAFAILTGILRWVSDAGIASRDGRREDVAVFHLDRLEITLPRALVHEVMDAQAMFAWDAELHALIIGHLEKVLRRHVPFGASLTEEAWARIPKADRIELLHLMAILLAHGCFRHPPRPATGDEGVP